MLWVFISKIDFSSHKDYENELWNCDFCLRVSSLRHFKICPYFEEQRLGKNIEKNEQDLILYFQEIMMIRMENNLCDNWRKQNVENMILRSLRSITMTGRRKKVTKCRQFYVFIIFIVISIVIDDSNIDKPKKMVFQANEKSIVALLIEM